MANIQQVTDLDFASIKNNLKDYFKRSGSPFKDWDFEGSGLNYLLDILAYNTHYNAVNAHLSMNESFLDSAQLRSNVVSRAKLIGYTPRSRRGARGVVSLSFSRNPDSTQDVLTLPRNSTFVSSFDGETYTFATTEDIRSIYDVTSGTFTFENVNIVQGTPNVRTFFVDNTKTSQKFMLDDENVDTSTMEVFVRNHQDTSDSRTFLNSDNFTVIDGDSLVYFLSENYEGKYQIEFGNDIIGKQLDNLNVVTIRYLSTNGPESNGARNFSFVSAPAGSDFSSIANELVSLTVVEPSYGGDERESIESIRQLAPLSYIAQNRTVTDVDYEALLRQNIPDLGAISIWGGEYNDPPIYGKVFIAANPKDSLFLSELQKEEILNYLNTVKIMTVTPEIVDPDYIFLYFDIFFKFNPNSTTFSRTQLESLVQETVEDFNTENLGEFDKVFRYSNFLTEIDNTDVSISNSFARIYTYKTFNIQTDTKIAKSVDFKFKLFGEVDQEEPFLSSTSWRYNNNDTYLEDEPIIGATNQRRIYGYRLAADGNTRIKIFPDLGRLNIDTGKITLDPIPTTFDTQIEISAIPDSYDIKTVRNQLVSIDTNKLTILGSKDTTGSGGSSGTQTYTTIPRFRD